MVSISVPIRSVATDKSERSGARSTSHVTLGAVDKITIILRRTGVYSTAFFYFFILILHRPPPAAQPSWDHGFCWAESIVQTPKIKNLTMVGKKGECSGGGTEKLQQQKSLAARWPRESCRAAPATSGADVRRFGSCTIFDIVSVCLLENRLYRFCQVSTRRANLFVSVFQ